MHRRPAGLIVALVCVVVLGACGRASNSSVQQSNTDTGSSASGGGALPGQEIPIGIAVAQTSDIALIGQEQVAGAEIAEQFFNDRGGVNGRQIKLVFQDTGGNEPGAINAFGALIQAGVVGIVGPSLSQQAFAADPKAEAAGVPVVAPSNTAKGIPQIGNFIARVSAPVAKVAPLAVEQALAMQPGIKTVAVAYAQNDAFSTSESNTFQETVKGKGLNLATVQTFQTSDTDFTTQANNLLSKKPQLIIVSGLPVDGGNLVKQVRELGYKGLMIAGNGLNSTKIFPVCGSTCVGLLIAQAYSPVLDSDMNKAFVTAFHKKQDQAQPAQFSAQAFTAVQVFVEALSSLDEQKQLSSLDLPTLRKELNAAILAGKYDTPLGPISFDAEGEINQEKFYVAEIANAAEGKSLTFKFVR